MSKKWYVLHTYSGYENKVKDTLEKSVENNGMQDLILDVRVPMEEVVEIRNGKRVKSTRKVYPGYVLVHMIETSESWYVVRNTRGVTGFVGPDGRPVPLTQEEVYRLGVEKHSVDVNYEVGDLVTIIYGSFDGFSGIVDKIDAENDTVRVIISMMGRDTPLELGLDQVEPAVD